MTGKTPLKIDGTAPSEIVEHHTAGGMLRFTVQFSDRLRETFSYCNMQVDCPALTAQYILDQGVGKRATCKRDIVQSWAKKDFKRPEKDCVLSSTCLQFWHLQ